MTRSTIFKDFIQVAGICDQYEADLLVHCGVLYLGFPLRLPVNKEDLTEHEAVHIISGFSGDTSAVLITYLNEHGEIIDFCDSLGASIVQLHGDIAMSELELLRQRRPDISIIKSLVLGEKGFQTILDYGVKSAAMVDAFITDTFDPTTGASGATGKTHDWSLSKYLVEALDKPVILAGGLTPDNVAEAIALVRPSGVDVHTGVEDAAGRKSEELVLRFVNEANNAFSTLTC